MRIATAIFLAAALAYQVAPAAGQAPDLRERGPIYIASDLDFTPANGVVGGLGTADSPYQIQGWTITGPPYNPLVGPGAAGPNAAVEIRDTTAHFVVSNLTISTPSDYGLAIALSNLQNASLRSNHITGFSAAIFMDNVATTSVVENTMVVKVTGDLEDPSTHGKGIVVKNSEGLLVAANDVSGDAGGAIELYWTHNATVIGNHVHDVTSGRSTGAIHLEWGDARVIDNTIERYGGPSGAWGGITAQLMENLVVSRNLITHTNATGRALIDVGAATLLVQENRVSSSHGFVDRALYARASRHGEVSGNSLVDSGGLHVRGGQIYTHDNSVLAGGTTGFAVYQVDEWTSHNDDIYGVAASGDGTIPVGLLVLQTNKSRVFGMHAHDNEGIGASFVGGDIETDGILVERNDHGGIEVAGVDRAVFRNCTVRDNGGLAIRVVADSTGREPRNVDVTDCEAASATTTRGSSDGREVPVPLVPSLLAVAAAGALRKHQECGPHRRVQTGPAP